MREQAAATEVINDERVRVTRFDFAPGAQTGWHVHGMDYVVTAITDCHMLLQSKDGEEHRALVPAGTSYRRMQGVEHNVINNGNEVMTFVEVELK